MPTDRAGATFTRCSCVLLASNFTPERTRDKKTKMKQTKMKDTILAIASRTFRAPSGYKGQFTITAKAYHIGGNSHPHFSVTGDISTPAERRRGDGQAGGCLHDEALAVWPEIEPIIRLHLSNADDGAPIHAESNGYYWLAGIVGGLGEKYHGGSGNSGKSPAECLKILADHLRVPFNEADRIATAIAATFRDSGSEAAKAAFAAYIDEQRPRWAQEAKDGLALIEKLAR